MSRHVLELSVTHQSMAKGCKKLYQVIWYVFQESINYSPRVSWSNSTWYIIIWFVAKTPAISSSWPLSTSVRHWRHKAQALELAWNWPMAIHRSIFGRHVLFLYKRNGTMDWNHRCPGISSFFLFRTNRESETYRESETKNQKLKAANQKLKSANQKPKSRESETKNPANQKLKCTNPKQNSANQKLRIRN